MKAKVRALLLAGVLSVSFAFTAVAAPTLDEVTNGNTTQQEEVQPFNGGDSSGGGSANVGGGSAIDALSKSVDVSGENETVKGVQEAAKGPLTIIFQLMAYAITIGLTFRVLCDLTYITIPPFRNILSGGRQGNPGSQQGQAGGMGMGGMSGGMGGQQQQGMGTCWVSQAAMDSIVAVDPATGRAGNPYKVYMKDMAVTCTLTTVLVVLALTGVLQQLGFMIGTMLSNGIGSML